MTPFEVMQRKEVVTHAFYHVAIGELSIKVRFPVLVYSKVEATNSNHWQMFLVPDQDVLTAYGNRQTVVNLCGIASVMVGGPVVRSPPFPTNILRIRLRSRHLTRNPSHTDV